MSKVPINPDNVWTSPSLYSAAMKVGNMVFVCGQLARDKEGNVVGEGDLEKQAEKAFQNVKEVLEAAGAKLTDVVKLNCYLTRQGEGSKAQAARRRFFPDHVPAVTTVVVQGLARPEFLIEVEAVAVIEK
ncbi:MAG: RidA family protein [Chloroflexi bacterium]|nr:RidA family protein [Chloroflexota bacterium]